MKMSICHKIYQNIEDYLGIHKNILECKKMPQRRLRILNIRWNTWRNIRKYLVSVRRIPDSKFTKEQVLTDDKKKCLHV